MNGPPSSRSGKGAFTLVELLVVIAVIAILASLLAAGLSRAKAAADSAACKGNLRQLGLAMKLYTDTYNAFPMVQRSYPTPLDPVYWHDLLEPFAGEKWPENNYPEDRFQQRRGVFVCPGYARIKGAIVANGGGFQFGSYDYNAGGRFFPGAAYPGDPPFVHAVGLGGRLATADDWKTYAVSPTREQSVLKPSEMIQMGDSILTVLSIGAFTKQVPAGYADRFDNDVYNEDDRSLPQVGLGYKNRHSDRWNVSFCDGHVENLKTEKLFDRYNDAVLQRWNSDNQPHR